MNVRTTSESSNGEIRPRHVYTESTQIKYPKINYVYHIKNKSLAHGELVITFIGNIRNVTNLDTSTFCYQTKTPTKTKHFRFSCTDDSSLFIYKNSLPISTLKNHIPPILYYSKNRPNHLEAIHEMQIELHESKYENYFYLQMIKSKPINNIKICNAELKEECQTLSGNIPVYAGQYPLFVEDKRPTYQVLKTLYNKFINYNDIIKLTEQYTNSKDWCTIRAHFVTTLLNQYGITCYKLFKEWNGSDWRKINSNIKGAWRYHCATMIIDSENRKWVWDPWVGMNKKLLTIPEWLRRNDEPIPSKLLLANSTILFDYVSGSRSTSEFLMDCDFEGYLFKTFQMLWSSAIPNSPEKPITGKNKVRKEEFTSILLSKNTNGFFSHANKHANKTERILSPVAIHPAPLSGANLIKKEKSKEKNEKIKKESSCFSCLPCFK